MYKHDLTFKYHITNFKKRLQLLEALSIKNTIQYNKKFIKSKRNTLNIFNKKYDTITKTAR